MGCDACKIEFGFVPNLSNCDNYFINVESVLSYHREECDFVHIWYSNEVPWVLHACKIAFASVPHLSHWVKKKGR